MQPIILGHFYNNYVRNTYISFQDLHGPRGFCFQYFQYNFDNSSDIHGMQPIILGYFFRNNYDGNKYILFQDFHDPRGVIFVLKKLIFFLGPMKVEWWILI